MLYYPLLLSAVKVDVVNNSKALTLINIIIDNANKYISDTICIITFSNARNPRKEISNE